MAEAILRGALGDRFRVASAGSDPASNVHPLAIRVMSEIGYDLGGHRPKHVDGFVGQPVDAVITVCGRADQACPVFPGRVKRHHFPFDDPAHATGDESAQLDFFRRVRDEIRRVFTAYAAGRLDALDCCAPAHQTR
jgi:arsenate reductase